MPELADAVNLGRAGRPWRRPAAAAGPVAAP